MLKAEEILWSLQVNSIIILTRCKGRYVNNNNNNNNNNILRWLLLQQRTSRNLYLSTMAFDSGRRIAKTAFFSPPRHPHTAVPPLIEEASPHGRNFVRKKKDWVALTATGFPTSYLLSLHSLHSQKVYIDMDHTVIREIDHLSTCCVAYRHARWRSKTCQWDYQFRWGISRYSVCREAPWKTAAHVSAYNYL